MAGTYIALRRAHEILSRDPLPFVTFLGPVKDPLHWECVMQGPDDSPYEDGVFKFSMKFDTKYPRTPPLVVFRNKIYHPNVSEAGVVLAGFLHSKWNSQTVADIIEDVWKMMANPSLEDDRYVVESIREEYVNNYDVFEWTAQTMTETEACGLD